MTYLNINSRPAQGLISIYDLELESIHQSCPQLEILKLNNFYMNIFEEYDTIIPNNNHINGVIKKLFPAQKQKEMNIHGIIIDSR